MLDGGLMVKETPSRRNSGTHYTPRSLAEEVVLHALQPLCYEPGPYQTADDSKWQLKSSDDILSLKVADIACGSGAFLVSAARYLADRVVESWMAEDPTNAHRRDLHLRAVREVVANCLYGADINDMAVEMCKLSLWLVSLDRDLPFSFVDDKIFLGNSLIGLTSLDQLRKLHIAPSRVTTNEMYFDIFDVDIDAIVSKAVDLRRKLATEIDELDPARNSAAKKRQLHELRRATDDLRTIADGVVAAGLRVGGKPGRALDEAYENLRIAVKAAYPERGEASRAQLEAIISHGLKPTVPTDYIFWRPLNWVVEAPDVLVEHGGFDAIVGNPPFLGGSKISVAMGSNVRDWLPNVLAEGQTGNADLVAFFFLRAMELLRESSTIGLIATNTIGQGRTREVSLDRMVDMGLTITRSVQSRPWPAESANLEYAIVWASTDEVSDQVPRVSDGAAVRRISTLLEPVGSVEGRPYRLRENLSFAYEGCKPYGKGFIIDRDEARRWIDADSRNSEVLFPYLNGEDINSRPDCSASRWIIDFFGLTIEQADGYPEPMHRVRTTVKPERERNNREARRKNWWLFAENAVGMRNAIRDFDEVLGIAKVSKTIMPMRLQTKQVFSEKVNVFVTDSYADQATLSSALHQSWSVKYSTTMRTDPTYSISDVLETFPRPQGTERLEQIGMQLDVRRREIMSRRGLGLTTLYNLINSPAITDSADHDIGELRAIHVELDEAVLGAYGWSGIPLGYGFHTYRQMERWTVSPAARVEILDRLLEENHRRAELEEVTEPAFKGRGARGKKSLNDGEGLF